MADRLDSIANLVGQLSISVVLQIRFCTLQIHFLFSLQIHFFEFLFRQGFHYGCSIGITKHVVSCATPIPVEIHILSGVSGIQLCNLHKPVNGPEKRDILVRGIYCSQDNQHQNQGSTWHASGSNTGCSGSQPVNKFS